MKGQLEKFFKRDAIIDLAFQLGIGRDTKPLLKKQAFKKHQRRIGIGALVAEPDIIMSHQNGVDSGPIDNFVELFKGAETSVFFHGTGQGQVSETEISFDLFKSHANTSRMLDFEAFMA
jgi:hypothetical protein